MPSDLVSLGGFEFNGDTHPLYERGGRRMLSFPRVCELFGVRDWQAEWKDLPSQYWALGWVAFEVNDKGMRLCLITIGGVLMWLGKVDTRSLSPALRDKHEDYLRDLESAVYAYQSSGVAIRPGTPDATVALEMAKYLERNGGERDRLLATDLVRSQVVALTAGTFSPGPQLATIRERILQLGYSYNKTHAQKIGRLAKDAYRKKTGGIEPATHPQWVDGGVTQVAAYPPDFLDQLDRIVNEYMREHGVRRRPAK